MSMQVLGISGKAGVGKDYTAEHIIEPLGFKRWSLAWHFKVWAVGRGLATYEEVFITKPPHVRKMLQEMGTEEGRKLYGESIWCNTAATWLRLLGETWQQQQIVVADVRFPNEVEMVRRLGGRVIRLVAPEREANSPLTAVQRQHESETSLDGFTEFDAVVQNDSEGTSALYAQLFAAFTSFGWDEMSYRLDRTQGFRFGTAIAG